MILILNRNNTTGQSICLHTFAKIQLSHHYKLLKILTTYRTTPTCCNRQTNSTDKSTHSNKFQNPSVPSTNFPLTHQPSERNKLLTSGT